MSKTTIKHNYLGEILVSQNPRARRISISVKPDGNVRLSMPDSVALVQGLRFLESKADWVASTREKMANNNPVKILSMPFSTRSHTLMLDPARVDNAKAKVSGDKIVVRYPLESSYQEKEVQDAIKKGIEDAWRKEANRILPERLNRLARMYGLSFKSVTIRNTISKWGSCSGRDDISLSLHLMRLPDHLINYILLHELCHTIHKNHGLQFNAMLDKYSGGRHKELRKELRQYQTRW